MRVHSDDRAGCELASERVRPLRAVACVPAATAVDPAVSLLQDAAVIVAARQELDALVGQLCAQPFSPATHTGLRAYLEGPAERACAAYERVCAIVVPTAH